MMVTLLTKLVARSHCRAEPLRGACPYHVDRSKLFVMDRLAKVDELDAPRIARAIECTRFPYSAATEENVDEEGSLLRAADLIGQLGDPHYLKKANALYYEFEEIGLNKQLGYKSPADLVDQYPQLYWKSVSSHIQSAISYLNITSSGRRWIASVYSNVFRAERELSLSGRPNATRVGIRSGQQNTRGAQGLRTKRGRVAAKRGRHLQGPSRRSGGVLYASPHPCG